MYNPLYTDQFNLIENCYIPSMVKNRNNKTYKFWERSLFQRLQSSIVLGVPKAWEGNIKDFLYACLFTHGFVPVWEQKGMGYVFNYGNLNGQNFYYQPTHTIITNPALDDTLELEIGKDCELLRLTPDYRGVMDIIGYYAEKLSVMDPAINISIINSKLSWMMFAKNKAAADTIKKAMDKVNQGEPAVFLDSKLLNDPATKDVPWQFLERTNIKNSYITTDLLMDFQTILNEFDAEIGIPTVPYQKKERMVSSEAESKQLDSTSRATVWIETLNSSIKQIKVLYPDLELTAKLRFDPEEQEDSQPDNNKKEEGESNERSEV